MKKEDDVAIDFSAIKEFLKHANMNVVVPFVLVIALLALVFTIRMLPASLPIVDTWAEQSMQQSIRNQVATQVHQQFPALPQANRETLINQRTAEAVQQNRAQMDASLGHIAAQLRERLQYVGENGKTYTYLGDLDSYFWLRYTRNYLEKGTICDAIIDNECRDMYAVAPVGVQAGTKTFFGWNPSFHVFAIAFLHKIITVFDSQYPLTRTSFLVPVFVSMLGVLPAFFLGRRLAGNVGGTVAAVLISLHPLLLSRSIGSDNDVWNVIMPVFVLWSSVELVEAETTKKRLLYGSLTGLFFGLHAATWIGWWFPYLIIFLGLLGYLGFTALSYGIRKRTYEVWKNKHIQSIAATLGIFYVAGFIGSFFAGFSPVAYVNIPKNALYSATTLAQAVGGNYWPNVLTTVAELNKSDFAGAVGAMGGRLSFFIALAGMLLLLLPQKKWQWYHWSVFGLGTVISMYLVNTPVSKFTALGLLLLPVAIVLTLYLLKDEKVDIAPALIILIWVLAASYAAYSGIRFILMMIPAFGIAYGVAAGRIYQWITSYLHKEFKWHTYIVNVLVFIVIILILIKPVKAGYNTASGFIPSISDGWWDALTKIKEESSPDAVINSWWDFGHWFKYVADRRVSADGTSQHTHVPRWLGLSLVTPDERESVGVLRMLNCGSDAYPSPDGDRGAYGKLLKRVQDPIVAQNMVRAVVVREKNDAMSYLRAAGLTEEQAADVLTATHCPEVEDYFITSGDMVGKAGVWAHFGLWDFKKAYIVEHRNEPKATLIPKLVEDFGYTKEEAETLHIQALGLRDEGSINAFVSPWPGYITGSWAGCHPTNESITCPLNLGIGNNNGVQTVLESFVYNKTKKEDSRVTVTFIQNGRVLERIENASPGTLLIASEHSFEEVEFSGAIAPQIAFVMDSVQNRILVAGPELARSMFTQLFYLDGRYAKYYEKFDERATYSGSRIVTWKVNWDGEKKRAGTTANIIR